MHTANSHLVQPAHEFYTALGAPRLSCVSLYYPCVVAWSGLFGDGKFCGVVDHEHGIRYFYWYRSDR